MTVLLVADINAGQLSVESTAKALKAVSDLGETHVLVAGKGVVEAATQAAQLAGVSKVLLADDPAYANGLAEPLAELVVSLATDYSHIVTAATSSGKNFAPRVAGLLDVMVISDVIQVFDTDTYARPIYAGNAIQKVRSSDPVKVITIRVANFDAMPLTGCAVIEPVAPNIFTNLSAWVEDKIVTSERPDLTAAKIVVSGGRGMGSKSGFELLQKLADKLDAAIGASRAAVDAGYAPNDWQVGQTGKIVAPDLYIAVGISGAIQHLAGMKDSKVIVAINKDEEAPIFQVADYGLVADLFQAVPDLTGKL